MHINLTCCPPYSHRYPHQTLLGREERHPLSNLARRSQPLQSGNIFKILALHFPNAGAHRMIWWKVKSENYARSVEEFSSTYFPNKYCGPGVYFFKFLGTVEKVTKLMKIALEEIPMRRRCISRRLRLSIRTRLFSLRRLVWRILERCTRWRRDHDQAKHGFLVDCTLKRTFLT